MNETIDPRTDKNEKPRVSRLILLAITVVLIVPLFELPRPSFITGLPWKVEFFTSLGIFTAAIFAYVTKQRSFKSLLDRGHEKWFFGLLFAFAAWSGISVLWAASPGSVIHHTFLWFTYLSFTLILLARFELAGGIDDLTDILIMLSLILGIVCVAEYASIVDFSASEGTLRIRWSKYAELLITLSPLLWAGILSPARAGRRGIIAAAAAFSWLTAMLSLSKAAFVGGIAAFVALFVLLLYASDRKDRKRVLLTAACWLALTVATQAGFAYFSAVPSTTQYISGEADASRSTSTMRVFTWKVAADMIAAHPILGVGADNFGIRFNEGRAAYAKAHPDDVGNAIGEDFLFERAHNEYVQILAELGLVGSVMAGAAFLLLIYLSSRAIYRLKGKSPYALIGSTAGIAAFAVSSLFTSFSFRAAQNGLVFFALVAVALFSLRTSASAAATNVPATASHSGPRFVLLFLLSAAGLFLFSATKGMSYYLVYLAEKQQDAESSRSLLQKAVLIDPDNGGAYYALSSVYGRAGEIVPAAVQLQKAIDTGIGASIAYSRLAQLQEKAGQPADAERTLQQAIAIYPRSIFLKVRYAVLLEGLNRQSESEQLIAAAKELDQRQAAGWYNLIKYRGLEAFFLSKEDPSIAPPDELLPSNAVPGYIDETVVSGGAN